MDPLNPGLPVPPPPRIATSDIELLQTMADYLRGGGGGLQSRQLAPGLLAELRARGWTMLADEVEANIAASTMGSTSFGYNASTVRLRTFLVETAPGLYPFSPGVEATSSTRGIVMASLLGRQVPNLARVDLIQEALRIIARVEGGIPPIQADYDRLRQIEWALGGRSDAFVEVILEAQNRLRRSGRMGELVEGRMGVYRQPTGRFASRLLYPPHVPALPETDWLASMLRRLQVESEFFQSGSRFTVLRVGPFPSERLQVPSAGDIGGPALERAAALTAQRDAAARGLLGAAEAAVSGQVASGSSFLDGLLNAAWRLNYAAGERILRFPTLHREVFANPSIGRIVREYVAAALQEGTLALRTRILTGLGTGLRVAGRVAQPVLIGLAAYDVARAPNQAIAGITGAAAFYGNPHGFSPFGVAQMQLANRPGQQGPNWQGIAFADQVLAVRGWEFPLEEPYYVSSAAAIYRREIAFLGRTSPGNQSIGVYQANLAELERRRAAGQSQRDQIAQGIWDAVFAPLAEGLVLQAAADERTRRFNGPDRALLLFEEDVARRVEEARLERLVQELRAFREMMAYAMSAPWPLVPPETSHSIRPITFSEEPVMPTIYKGTVDFNSAGWGGWSESVYSDVTSETSQSMMAKLKAWLGKRMKLSFGPDVMGCSNPVVPFAIRVEDELVSRDAYTLYCLQPGGPPIAGAFQIPTPSYPTAGIAAGGNRQNLDMQLGGRIKFTSGGNQQIANPMFHGVPVVALGQGVLTDPNTTFLRQAPPGTQLIQNYADMTLFMAQNGLGYRNIEGAWNGAGNVPGPSSAPMDWFYNESLEMIELQWKGAQFPGVTFPLTPASPVLTIPPYFPLAMAPQASSTWPQINAKCRLQVRGWRTFQVLNGRWSAQVVAPYAAATKPNDFTGNVGPYQFAIRILRKCRRPTDASVPFVSPIAWRIWWPGEWFVDPTGATNQLPSTYTFPPGFANQSDWMKAMGQWQYIQSKKLGRLFGEERGRQRNRPS